MRRERDPEAHFDAEKGKWVTTHEKKRRIHINENGVPDKGNPFIIAKMTGTKAKVSTGYQKKNLHTLLSKGKADKAVKALKGLDEGATITTGSGTTYTKVGSGFVSSKGGGSKQTPQAIAKILGGHVNAGKDFTVDDPKPGAMPPTVKKKGSAPASSKVDPKIKALKSLAGSGSTKISKIISVLKDVPDGTSFKINGYTYTKETQTNTLGDKIPKFVTDSGYHWLPSAMAEQWKMAVENGQPISVDDGSPAPDSTSQTAPTAPSVPTYPKNYSTGQLGASHGSTMGSDPMTIPPGPPKLYKTDSGHEFVDAGNILSSCKSTDTTKDIIEKQGFSGLPRRVSKEEFQKIAKQSGFVSKRTYCAASPELAAEYRNQLYNGDFYVDCSVGGAQYGQGMYCAADYTGKGYNAGIDAEMKHYQSLNIARQADNAFILGCSTSDLNKAIDECKAQSSYGYWSGYKHLSPSEHEVFKKWVTHQVLSPAEKNIMENHGSFANVQKALETSTSWGFGSVSSNKSKSATKNKFLQSYKGYTKTEVVTLDPSAKIISYTALKAKYKAYSGKKPKDLGAFAAALGYDAINAHGHGQSGSYTVILNRTKCVFLDKPLNGDAADPDRVDDEKIRFVPGENGQFHAYRGDKYLGWVDVFIGKGEN